jgi:L-asparagine transporter-like permease
MWLFPWASYAAIAGMLAVLIAMACTPALVGDLRASIVALAVALSSYLIIRARRQSSRRALVVPTTK